MFPWDRSWVPSLDVSDATGGGSGEGDGPDADKGDGSTDVSGSGTKTYSKSEVDGIVRRAVDKARRDFGDYNELRDKAQKFDDLQAASQTAEERLRKSADQAIRDREAALEVAKSSLMRAALVNEAQKQGAVDPDTVAALVDPNDVIVDLQKRTVDGADTAVKALLAAKPFLLKAGAARAGTEMAANQGRASTRVTQREHREWLQRGMTAEEADRVKVAIRNGTYVVG